MPEMRGINPGRIKILSLLWGKSDCKRSFLSELRKAASAGSEVLHGMRNAD